jgi:hypothetical protein
MNIVDQLKRLIPAVTCASLVVIVPSVHAWDWTWGWGGKSIKGSGIIKTESRNVTDFNRISLSIPAKVEMIQDSTESVTIVGDDNIVPLLETVVENDGLKIRFADKNLSTDTRTLSLVVHVKSIEALSVAGSGDLHAENLQTAMLKASIAGAGNVSITNLDADTLMVSIAGIGNFVAGGKAKTIEAKIAGSGDVKVGRLEANSVKVSVAGSGNATVWAKQLLAVRVAGSGDVKYYGDAKVSQSVAGSGSIKRLGSAP